MLVRDFGIIPERLLLLSRLQEFPKAKKCYFFLCIYYFIKVGKRANK
jgi:hypothetical protein